MPEQWFIQELFSDNKMKKQKLRLYQGQISKAVLVGCSTPLLSVNFDSLTL